MSNKKVLQYFNESWLPRLRKNHNPKSLAMHLGYFNDDKLPSDLEKDEAKSAMNEFLASHLPLSSSNNTSIIDAGCGVGGTCLFLAEKHNNINVTGVNIDTDQIELAREFAEQKGLVNKINFLIEDYTQTTIDTGTADGLYAMESMCYASDKKMFLNEANRILKPNGTLLIFDYFLKIDETESMNQDVIDLLHDFSIGWAVEEYTNIKFDDDVLNNGFSTVESYSLKKNVYSGIKHSYNKSKEILNNKEEYSDIYLLHAKALIALKKLVDLDIVDYRMIKAKK